MPLYHPTQSQRGILLTILVMKRLSMAAMHEVRYPDFLSPSMFVALPSDDIGAMMNNFASLVLDDQSFVMPLKAPSGQDTHAFSILARVLEDPSLTSTALHWVIS